MKIYLVVRRGWQVSINQRSVTEVREQETHADISSEETTSHHLLWDLNTWAIHQHCVLSVCIPTRRNCMYIYIYINVPAFAIILVFIV